MKKMRQRQRFSKKNIKFFYCCILLIVNDLFSLPPTRKKHNDFFYLMMDADFVICQVVFWENYFIKSSLDKLIQEFIHGVRVLELLIVRRERLRKKI